jgi:hypothetical protein
MFQCFRMTHDERRVAELIRSIAEGRNDVAGLLREFPELLSSTGNRLAIRTSILARAAALRVLEKHGGGANQYFAVRFIVACQSLAISRLQT